MPVKATKAIEGIPSSVVFSTYVTELPVAPAAGHLSVYVDLAVADQHRLNETYEEIRAVVDYAREQEYDRPSTAIGYYYKTLDGKAITYTEVSTGIVEGMVALGIHSAIQIADFGSIIMDAGWQQIVEQMLEFHRMTV